MENIEAKRRAATARILSAICFSFLIYTPQPPPQLLCIKFFNCSNPPGSPPKNGLKARAVIIIVNAIFFKKKKIHPLKAPLSSLLWSSRHLRTWPSYGELDSQKSRAIYIYFLIVLSPRNRKRLKNKRVDCRNFSVFFLFTPLITPPPPPNKYGTALIFELDPPLPPQKQKSSTL